MTNSVKHTRVVRSFVLLFICIMLLVSSFAFTGCAAKNDFSSTINTKSVAANKGTYPYDSKTATIKRVGLDIVYGNQRSLVVYTGEVPYKETTDDKGNRIDLFKGKYANEGTSISKSFTIDGKTLSVEEYWGKGVKPVVKDNKITLAELEKVNKDGIKSLRLYGSSIAVNDTLLFIGNAAYMAFSAIAGFALTILRIIISAKNLDASLILKAFRLQEVTKVMNETFIWESKDGSGHISVFTAICLLLLITTIVGFAIGCARGNNTAIGIKDFGIWVLVGALIIGMALTNRLYTLGGILSTAVTKITYTVAGMASNSDAFTTSISDPQHEGEIAQMQEMSIVNKAYIDIQICTQFRANDIADLSMSNLGDVSYNKANKYLYGINGVDLKSDFDNNIGYYFWFADSGAESKTSKNATLPKTNPASTSKKLRSMITWMQTVYNEANDTQKEQLRIMMQGFSSPDSLSGFTRMFLLSAIVILLCLCLWRYAKDILLAKIQMMVALLGLAIAGPLMITGKKKLIDTGKDLIAVIFISFIEITIHSLVFDGVLFLVSTILGPDFFRLVVALILSLLLFKFNKLVNEKIHEFTKNAEASMMSSNSMVAGAKRRFNTWAGAKTTKIAMAIDSKVQNARDFVYDDDGNILRDKDGNAITKKRFANNPLGAMIHAAANSTKSYEETKNDGLWQYGKDAIKGKREEKVNIANARLDEAIKKVNEINETIKNTAEQETSTIAAERKKKFSEINKEALYNEEERTMSRQRAGCEEEKKKLDETLKGYQKQLKDLDEDKNNGRISEEDYKAVVDQINAEHSEVAAKWAATDAQSESLNKAIQESLQARADKMVFDEHNIDEAIREIICKDGHNISDEVFKKNLIDGLTLNAQNANQAQLSGALSKEILEADRNASIILNKDDKVNGKKGVNTAAMQQANAARLQKAQVDAGVRMSSDKEAEQLMLATTNIVAEQEEFSLNHNAGYAAATQQINEAKGMDKGLFGFKRTNAIVKGNVQKAKNLGKAVAGETGNAVKTTISGGVHNVSAAEVNAVVGQTSADYIVAQQIAGKNIQDIHGPSLNEIRGSAALARQKHAATRAKERAKTDKQKAKAQDRATNVESKQNKYVANLNKAAQKTTRHKQQAANISGYQQEQKVGNAAEQARQFEANERAAMNADKARSEPNFNDLIDPNK